MSHTICSNSRHHLKKYDSLHRPHTHQYNTTLQFRLPLPWRPATPIREIVIPPQIESALKKTSATIIIWDVEGNVWFILNTKLPQRDIWLLRYKQDIFGYFRTMNLFNFLRNWWNCFINIKAIKYSSAAVLCSKQMVQYPLSPHINIVDEAFLQAKV